MGKEGNHSDAAEPSPETSKRRFLAEGMVHLAGGAGWLVERSVAPITRAIAAISAPGGTQGKENAGAETPAPVRDPRLVRTSGQVPPGAVSGERFRELCTSCGDCATVCHRAAIEMVPADGERTLPLIDPNVAACDMCGLCMESCPTGALEKTPREGIRLGRVKWFPDHCLRVAKETEDDAADASCDACFRACPFPWRALRYIGSAVAIGQACTGCGLCVEACPTLPRALLVLPADADASGHVSRG